MNIPANRKAKIRIIIEDKNGNPIGNEKMHIDLQKHKFLFGCGAFDINNYMNTDDEEQKKFFEDRTNKWLDVFNYATLPFYWGQFEPEEVAGFKGLIDMWDVIIEGVIMPVFDKYDNAVTRLCSSVRRWKPS